MSTTSTGTLEVIDTLALLALKVAPNIFDISSGQQHVSIRDQIARAQILIRDLHLADDGFRSVLIVGASAAGVSAAFAAAGLDKKVMVVDTQTESFSLQAKAAGRYVGPFMYEWPSIVSSDQSYPPAGKTLWGRPRPHTPTWKSSRPMPASKLALDLRSWLKDSISAMGTGAPAFVYGVHPGHTRSYIHSFKNVAALNLERRLMYKREESLPTYSPWLAADVGAGEAARTQIVPDYIILAAGMGAEETTLPGPPKGCPRWTLKGPNFWGSDNLRSGFINDANVGIFGGGDGALQDVLRALTIFEHPLDMLDFLNQHKEVKRAIDAELPTLSAIEAQSRLICTWTGDKAAYAEIDTLCRQVAGRLARRIRVRSRVAKTIRAGAGTVQHFVSESYFSKTYLLNRFLVHLIDLCQQYTPWPANKIAYRLTTACKIDWGVAHRPPLTKYLVKVTKDKSSSLHFFDEIAVRFGLEHGSTPGMQMVKLSHHDSGQRSSLSRVPMAFLVPS